MKMDFEASANACQELVPTHISFVSAIFYYRERKYI